MAISGGRGCVIITVGVVLGAIAGDGSTASVGGAVRFNLNRGPLCHLVIPVGHGQAVAGLAAAQSPGAGPDPFLATVECRQQLEIQVGL